MKLVFCVRKRLVLAPKYYPRFNLPALWKSRQHHTSLLQKYKDKARDISSNGTYGITSSAWRKTQHGNLPRGATLQLNNRIRSTPRLYNWRQVVAALR